MPAELTQTTFDIPTSNGERFICRIPSVREYARVGARAHSMRIADSPATNGSEWGLDPLSSDLYRGMAIMEVLLSKADAKDNWPFTERENKPVVDSTKFPPFATLTVVEVGRGFDEAYRRFLDGGAGDGERTGESPVGDEPSGS